MSIIAAYNEAWDTGNVEALAEILHDEFSFNPHVGGVTMGKSDVLAFAGSNAPTSENDRILFENNEVGVAHSIVHFANGSTSEAVLSFLQFKDGKIISMETGATPLSEDYKLVGSEWLVEGLGGGLNPIQYPRLRRQLDGATVLTDWKPIVLP